MLKTILILSAMSAAVVITLFACQDSSANEKKQVASLSQADMVKRGEYLVNIVGCDDCHSPKRMGAHGPEVIPELRLSGYPSSRPIQVGDSNVVKKGWALFGGDLTSAVGEWGMSFTANLTPDATGIGNWPEENFIRAIRQGKYKGLAEGRDLLPPMPWFIYKNMTDEDLKSIFAYLKTIKPVENVVPAPKTFAELK
jgi:Cytochrome c